MKMNQRMYIVAISFILSIFWVSAYSEYNVDEHTLALWHFNGNFIDEVSQKENLYNKEKVFFSVGRFNKSLVFHSVQDSAWPSVQLNQPLVLGDEFTIEFWLNAPFTNLKESTYNAYLLSFYSVAQNTHLLTVYYDAGNADAGFKIDIVDPEKSGNDYYAGISKFPVLDNQWHHIALARKNDAFSVFIDGKLWKTTPINSSYVLQSDYLYLGQPTLLASPLTSQKAPFSGWIDELRISNTARTLFYAETIPTQQNLTNISEKISELEKKLSDYYTKKEVDEKMELIELNQSNTSERLAQLNDKFDEYYTKIEIEEKLEFILSALKKIRGRMNKLEMAWKKMSGSSS